MKKLTWILIAIVILACCSGSIGCAGSQKETPTQAPTSTPTPTAAPLTTPTPKPINWTSVSEKIDKLATDNSFLIQSVQQLGDNIVEIGGLGGCTNFANAVNNEAEFVLIGKPLLAPEGNCTIWFRVLPLK